MRQIFGWICGYTFTNESKISIYIFQLNFFCNTYILHFPRATRLTLHYLIFFLAAHSVEHFSCFLHRSLLAIHFCKFCLKLIFMSQVEDACISNHYSRYAYRTGYWDLAYSRLSAESSLCIPKIPQKVSSVKLVVSHKETTNALGFISRVNLSRSTFMLSFNSSWLLVGSWLFCLQNFPCLVSFRCMCWRLCGGLNKEHSNQFIEGQTPFSNACVYIVI